MADESNRIGSSRTGSVGTDLLRQLGIGSTAPVSAPSEGVSQLAGSSGDGRTDKGAIGGPRGNRILPADFPLDQLDRRAARGTYIDIVV
jgi:hypothetical protein